MRGSVTRTASRWTARFCAPALVVCAALALAGPAASARPLQTAVLDHWPSNAGPWFDRVRSAGARSVRMPLAWSDAAPSTRPADLANPNSYHWAWFDAQVKAARAAGLEPFVSVFHAPSWAIDRSLGATSTTPTAADLGAFARAAATRYSGRFRPCADGASCDPLPRVRYWQAWNEPNISVFLQPQWHNGRFVSPRNYREMVNAFSNGVKGVATSDGRPNLVIAGGTAPFSASGNGVLPFMRDMLCLTAKLRPIAGCAASRFDIWAHHPYTMGGPNRSAAQARNVSLGDLPQMKRVLQAANRANTIRREPGRAVEWWVTEFSWDTKGPDPRMIDARTHARWVAEALYRMWQSGITLVTWFQLKDEPLSTSRYQSGLHYVDWRRKRAFQAFRFPFVALAKSGRVTLWGRVPPAARNRERVVIQRQKGSRWVRFTTLRTNRHGIFTARPRSSLSRTSFRAVITRGRTTTRSLPFHSGPTKDVFLELGPFGCGGPDFPC